jgi:hypothetical protein
VRIVNPTDIDVMPPRVRLVPAPAVAPVTTAPERPAPRRPLWDERRAAAGLRGRLVDILV